MYYLIAFAVIALCGLAIAVGLMSEREVKMHE